MGKVHFTLDWSPTGMCIFTNSCLTLSPSLLNMPSDRAVFLLKGVKSLSPSYFPSIEREKLQKITRTKSIKHPRFGDLSDPGAVEIGKNAPRPDSKYTETDGTIIHLTVTGRCYARCQGCVNSAITLGCSQPRNSVVMCEDTVPERDAEIIHQLLEESSSPPVTICFYGGEPFLAVEKMAQLRRLITEKENSSRIRYMVYTNGELLADAVRLYPQLIGQMWLFSVSIDGGEEQHNRVRKGTRLSRIIENLEILNHARQGQVLHWSTLREDQSLTDCFRQFMELHQRGLADHFFWHWAESAEPFHDLPGYIQRYGHEFEMIMDDYLSLLSKGVLLPVAHVNELVLYLITGKERGHSACGVELAKNYDIAQGKIYACADLPEEFAYAGHNHGNGPGPARDALDLLTSYKNPLGCYTCGVHAYCGGRCPVQALAGSPERTRQYCQLMRLHVGIVNERIMEIDRLLHKNGLTPQDIYDRSAHIARYTDVVP